MQFPFLRLRLVAQASAASSVFGGVALAARAPLASMATVITSGPSRAWLGYSPALLLTIARTCMEGGLRLLFVRSVVERSASCYESADLSAIGLRGSSLGMALSA